MNNNNKEQTKTYIPSPNLKTIVIDIGKSNKKTIDDLEKSTKFSRPRLIATATAKSNKPYIDYQPKQKVLINNELVEQKAYIQLTELGKELLKELTKNDN